MKRILILEADQQFAAELEDAIRAQFAYETATAPTVREGCLLLAQQPYDLAFVPQDDLPNVIRSLHSLQPGLPLIVLVPDEEDAFARAFHEAVKGTLLKTDVEEELPALLETLEPAPVQEAVAEHATAEGATVVEPGQAEEEPGDEASLDATLSQETLSEEPAEQMLQVLKQITREEKVLGALISLDEFLLAHNGKLDPDQVDAIRERIASTWRASNTAQIQFIRLASRSGDLLLFTRPIGGDSLLTVAALPDLHVGELRRKTDRLMPQLTPLVRGEERVATQSSVVSTTRPLASGSGDGTSYALVWRPRQAMPGMLQIALRRALERIAEAHDCDLRHLIVDAELVHIVVHCPGGRTAASLAHLFKREAEAEIQQQFGVPAQLWDRGYYAAESDEPLSDVELNLFLGSRTQS